jgi:CheY-like chemotaxis protein
VTLLSRTTQSALQRDGRQRVRRHVAVAEDNDEMRRLLADVLKKEGYDVTACASGDELLDALLRMQAEGTLPDLIVSDLRMPGTSGFGVLEKMLASNVHVPVILVSAFCNERTLNEAARLGAVCVLSKPFDMDVLRNAVLCVLVGAERPIL